MSTTTFFFSCLSFFCDTFLFLSFSLFAHRCVESTAVLQSAPTFHYVQMECSPAHCCTGISPFEKRAVTVGMERPRRLWSGQAVTTFWLTMALFLHLKEKTDHFNCIFLFHRPSPALGASGRTGKLPCLPIGHTGPGLKKCENAHSILTPRDTKGQQCTKHWLNAI